MNILFWFETHSVHGALQGTTLLLFRAIGPASFNKEGFAFIEVFFSGSQVEWKRMSH
jgi:hypothetical protein